MNSSQRIRYVLGFRSNINHLFDIAILTFSSFFFRRQTSGKAHVCYKPSLFSRRTRQKKETNLAKIWSYPIKEVDLTYFTVRTSLTLVYERRCTEKRPLSPFCLPFTLTGEYFLESKEIILLVKHSHRNCGIMWLNAHSITFQFGA